MVPPDREDHSTIAHGSGVDLATTVSASSRVSEIAPLGSVDHSTIAHGPGVDLATTVSALSRVNKIAVSRKNGPFNHSSWI